MKKIYFACSISAGRHHAHVYPDIVNYIKGEGMHVLSEIFADQKVTAQDGPTPHFKPYKIWKTDVDWVREADAVIAEVTVPSLGIGYEIGVAESCKIPVLALHNKAPGRRLSAMITGNPHVTVFEYDDIAQTQAAIKSFIKQL